MKQATFAYSFQGSSHIKKEENIENMGKKFPCQDRSYSGDFESSEVTEKKEVTLFVKDRSNLFSRVQLPVELNPHKAGFSLVCVSDGHGGAPYFKSQKGAEFAIQTSIELLSESVDKIAAALQDKNYSKVNKNLSKSFVRRWIRKIMSDIASTNKDELLAQIKDLEQNDEKAAKTYRDEVKTAYALAEKYEHLSKVPVSDNDENTELSSILNEFTKLEIKSMYGCTAVVYFQIKESPLWYAFKIGDSDFMASFNGVFVKPIADDPQCHENVTTSLCDSNAAKNFRFPEEQYLDCIPENVFLSSDGVANSFPTEEYLVKFYNSVIFSYDEEGSFYSENDVKETLPQLSIKGSGDDITLACIISYDDTVEGKTARRANAKQMAKKYIEEGKYEQVYPVFKPYLDRNESDFKYLMAVYDYNETIKYAKSVFDSAFLQQWNKAYLNINAAISDSNLINKAKNLNKAIPQLNKLMEVVMNDDINDFMDNRNFEYIDNIFTPYITDGINLYSYYKVLYEYKLLLKFYEKGLMTIFTDMFARVEADLILLANAPAHNFVCSTNTAACRMLSDMYTAKSKYWSMKG